MIVAATKGVQFLGCLIAAVLGSAAALFVTLGVPSSRENVHATLAWGATVGCIVGIFTIVVQMRSRRVGWARLTIYGILASSFLSYVSMWWEIVSSLG